MSKTPWSIKLLTRIENHVLSPRFSPLEPMNFRFKTLTRSQSSSGRCAEGKEGSQDRIQLNSEATLKHKYKWPALRSSNTKRIRRLLLWIQGKDRQHFGPKCRVPGLFLRRDYIYFTLQEKPQTPLSKLHHDVFESMIKVASVEQRIHYKFRNKFLCIEALKATGPEFSLHLEGWTLPMPTNRRLALLGDRVLSLILCELWYKAGYSTREYNVMSQDVLTRAALAVKGQELNIDKNIILLRDVQGATSNQIAETFEAILGAVYIDSGKQLPTVQHVLTKVGLTGHEMLESPAAMVKAENEKAEIQRCILEILDQRMDQ